jgi:hypothetical protein
VHRWPALCRGGALSSVRLVSAPVFRATPDPRHAWLGLVLPRSARRFRTEDPALASLLAKAGGQAVESDPDVEIGDANRLRGDAPCVVVPFYRWSNDGGSRGLRGVRRLASFTRLAADLRRASRAVRGLGYPASSSIRWERAAPVVGPGLPEPERSHLAHRLPLNAVLIAHRGRPEPTIFEEVIAAACREVGQRRPPSRVVFGSSGVVVAELGSAVLRLAVGPARSRLRAQRETITQLRASEPPSDVARRVPQLIAHGSEGVAEWTLEERLPGRHPSRLSGDLAEDCLDFLAGLGRLSSDASTRSRLEAGAEAVAAACGDGLGGEVLEVASEAAAELDGHSACFVHGDFWSGNLLAVGDRLTGVIDWSAGGPDGMPLLDVLHLRLSSIRERTREPLGHAVAKHLLSGETAGDDDVLRAYSTRLGLRFSPAEQRALATAYWLDALARELRDPDSLLGPEAIGWRNDNVRPVLTSLERSRASSFSSATPRMNTGNS